MVNGSPLQQPAVPSVSIVGERIRQGVGQTLASEKEAR